MPTEVDTKHEQYKEYEADYLLIADVKAGDRRIKEQGTKYLPKLTGQTPTQYMAYKDRGVFYGATSRTITGLTGALMRRSPEVEHPNSIKPVLEDVTSEGYTLEEVMQSTAESILSFGRHGILVDLADSHTSNIYLTEYEAVDILNWRTEVIDGQRKLVFIALVESDERVSTDNEFETEYVEQIRVLKIEDGAVVVNLYERESLEFTSGKGEKTTDQTWQQVDVTEGSKDHYPKKKGGQPLTEIPFVFFGAVSNSVEPNKPPLLDLVNLNLSHWKVTADYYHGLHFCALPTPYLLGAQDAQKAGSNFKMGPGSAFVSTNENAEVGMLEFTGRGLSAVRDALKDLESKMAVLGARLLEEQKRAAETAEALTIRASGDSATLSSIASNLDSGFEKVLWYITDWLSTSPGKLSVETNKDFVAKPMEPRQIAALLQAVQAGRISMNTFLYQLKLGEILPEHISIDEELKLLEESSQVPFSGEEPEEEEEEDEAIENMDEKLRLEKEEKERQAEEEAREAEKLEEEKRQSRRSNRNRQRNR